jgi:hypothetical protein
VNVLRGGPNFSGIASQITAQNCCVSRTASTQNNNL